MDSALEKSENKCQKILENSQNIQKMDNYIWKHVHIPKMKIWGVTILFENKMEVCKEKINFLGHEIGDGKIYLQEHNAKKDLTVPW